MIPEWPFKHLVPGDFLVYAGRREDEADIEPLWQPLYDRNHRDDQRLRNRHLQESSQTAQERLNEGRA